MKKSKFCGPRFLLAQDHSNKTEADNRSETVARTKNFHNEFHGYGTQVSISSHVRVYWGERGSLWMWEINSNITFSNLPQFHLLPAFFYHIWLLFPPPFLRHPFPKLQPKTQLWSCRSSR
uniref:Uncharacterized protein n=1 Tax=Rhizophora mucronata TaxID=61149 RepID=A0A2P2JCB7_RHIMU